MKLTSPFADAEAPAAPAAEHTPDHEHRAPASRPVRLGERTGWQPLPRRGLLDRGETWMPGVSSARLPAIATVRAYHRAHEYVRSEAEWRIWSAVFYGWCAVGWVGLCTLAAWAGAGDYRRRLRKLWQVGVPGLYRAQLPPLQELSGAPLVWVAAWSALGWVGLKFWRPVMTLVYLLAALLPILL